MLCIQFFCVRYIPDLHAQGVHYIIFADKKVQDGLACPALKLQEVEKSTIVLYTRSRTATGCEAAPDFRTSASLDLLQRGMDHRNPDG